MAVTIGICPDDVPEQTEEKQYAPRWAKWLESHGHRPVIVDVHRDDVLEQIVGCDGLMWRMRHTPSPRLYAKRLLNVVEKQMGMPVFPNWETRWHYDDKIAQRYLLEAAGIPTPKTWVFWRKEDAIDFIRDARFPLVLKLSGGASSQNVALIESRSEAIYWIRQLFDRGILSLSRAKPLWRLRTLREWRRRIYDTVSLLLSGHPPAAGAFFEMNKSYILLQEYLPNNDYDTRITVIGNRAFGFRRFNRANSFTASGSGKIDYQVDQIDQAFVRLAFKTARTLKTQSVAIDGMYRGEQATLGEISYTYLAQPVYDCPGHWKLTDGPETGRLEWVQGNLWPPIAIIEDFVFDIEKRSR